MAASQFVGLIEFDFGNSSIQAWLSSPNLELAFPIMPSAAELFIGG